MNSLVNAIIKHKENKKQQEAIDKKEPDDYSSFVEGKDFIAEQVYTEKGEHTFCVYNYETLEMNYQTRVFKDGLMYAPIVAEEVTKKVISMPSEALDYGDDEKLEIELKAHINKWLDIPEDVLQFAIWNIKRSWVFQRFHTLNYLRALGDIGQGKSRFLDVLGLLHYKPVLTSGATTSAPIFRLIEKWKGTLIIDEGDFKNSDETEDIVKIINLGYERGRSIIRCDKNHPEKINCFDPYCPKLIATRRSFEDKAVESRCITQVMKGTSRKDIPVTLNKKFFDDTLRLRNKLLMWRFKNYYKINPDATMEFNKELEPRVRQIVSSFASLFINDEDKIDLFKKYIEKYQSDLIEERQNSFDGQIIGAIHKLISDQIIEFDAKDIVEIGELKDFKGNIINPRSLSSKLKALGFEKTTPKWIDGKTKKVIPISKELLENLFKRYGFDTYCLTNLTVLTVTLTEQKKLNDSFKNNENIAFTGLRNDSNDRKTVMNSITTLKGLFKRIEPVLMPCFICGGTHSKGWDLENQKDGRVWCDVCAGVGLTND